MSDHELDPGDSERARLLHQVRHLQHEVQRLEGVSGGLASSHASLRQELEAALARATEAEAKLSALTVADAEKPQPGDDRVEPLRRILGVGRALLAEADQALERLFDRADALDGEFTAAEKECDSRHGGMGVLLIHRQRDEAMKRAAEAERRLKRFADEALAGLAGMTCTPEEGYLKAQHCFSTDLEYVRRHLRNAEREAIALRAALAASEEKARELVHNAIEEERDRIAEGLDALGDRAESGSLAPVALLAEVFGILRALSSPSAGPASEANEKCGIRISGDEWCALPHPHDGPHRGKQPAPASEEPKR